MQQTQPTSDPAVVMVIVRKDAGSAPHRIVFRHRVHGVLLVVRYVRIATAVAGVEITLQRAARFPAAERAALRQLQRRVLAGVVQKLGIPARPQIREEELAEEEGDTDA